MAEIPVQKVGLTGLQLGAMTAAATPSSAQTGRDKFLVVRNTNAAIRTIGIAVPGNDFTGAGHPDMAVAVPATTGFALIPLPDVYQDPGTTPPMQAAITVTPDATGVTWAVVSV